MRTGALLIGHSDVGRRVMGLRATLHRVSGKYLRLYNGVQDGHDAEPLMAAVNEATDRADKEALEVLADVHRLLMGYRFRGRDLRPE